MSMFTCICCLTRDTCVVTMCFCTFVYLDPNVFLYVTVSEFGLKLIVYYKCCQFVVIRRYLVVNVILDAFSNPGILILCLVSPSVDNDPSNDDCQEDNSEDYQNCSMLYCVPQLYSVIMYTHMSSSYR